MTQNAGVCRLSQVLCRHQLHHSAYQTSLFRGQSIDPTNAVSVRLPPQAVAMTKLSQKPPAKLTLASPSNLLLQSLLEGYKPTFRPHRLGREVEAVFQLAPQQQMCYYDGKLFGGYLALLLDQILADCCQPAVTAYLNTSFKHSISPQAPICFRAWPDKIEGRKIYLQGSVQIPGHGGEVVEAIHANALFIQPKN